MARVPRHQRLIEKAKAAMLASIEIYNKPSFHYREESFAILALNAWELLLKARLIVDNQALSLTSASIAATLSYQGPR